MPIPGLIAPQRRHALGGVDGYTKLLLHGDGADASTAFTDSSASAHTVTANGNAQIDTAQSKFGGASALFDGSGDYLSTPHSADFDFTGDFTIDFWARPSAMASWTVLAGTVSGAGQPGFQLANDAADGRFSLWNGTSKLFSWTGTALSTGSWQHVAYVRSGSAYFIFKDGVQVGTGSNSTNFTTTQPLWIGNTPEAQAARWFNGWIDEFRISKGIARWSANFTPPTGPYS